MVSHGTTVWLFFHLSLGCQSTHHILEPTRWNVPWLRSLFSINTLITSEIYSNNFSIAPLSNLVETVNMLPNVKLIVISFRLFFFSLINLSYYITNFTYITVFRMGVLWSVFYLFHFIRLYILIVFPLLLAGIAVRRLYVLLVFWVVWTWVLSAHLK